MSAFHPLRTSAGAHTISWMAPSAIPRNELWLGCATLLALFLGTVVFGFHHVGRFCLFAAPALLVLSGVKRGKFNFIIGGHDLSRSESPAAFWIVVAAGSVLAGFELWQFLDGVLGSSK